MLAVRTLAAIGGIVQVTILLGLLWAAVSSFIVVSGWCRQRDLRSRGRQAGLPRPFELGQTPFVSGLVDVGREAEAVLRQLEGRAAKQFVGLEMAVEPGLSVRVDPGAFKSVLFDLVDNAIDHAPCGRVLLAAARSGNRVQVSVSDDGAGADGARRRASLREAERLAALHGAVMQVEARPSEGTTVYYRLPISDSSRLGQGRGEAADAARAWHPARSEREVGSVHR